MASLLSALAWLATIAAPAAAADSPSIYQRALALYREERFSQASDLLESELNGPLARTAAHHVLLGWCRYRLDQNDLALASFKEALRGDAGSAEALEGVARSAARLGRTAEAMDAVVDLTRLHPEVEVDQIAESVGVGSGASDRRLRQPRTRNAGAAGSTPVMVSRAAKSYFEVRSSASDRSDLPDRADRSNRSRRSGATSGWSPIFVKGVNLGAALPGKYPAEFPRGQQIYAEWLGQMADMGANAVRLYTLLPPEFYRALREHNVQRAGEQGYLWLVQGVWTELPEGDQYDAPEFRGQFLQEIERVIDAVHGNILVAPRRGHASGLYKDDVSAMTLGYILGREWEPYSVAAFDGSVQGEASYHGQFFVMARGTRTEAWLASVMDHAASHEMRQYNAQRPVAFTNWPTLDPLHHPTEATKTEEMALLRALDLPQEPGTLLEYDNDGSSIDANHIVPTARMRAGTFAAYHAYPYYPDFMNVDPGYLRARTDSGPSTYFGYMKELKAHHKNLPVLIAEVGVPTSRGIAHHQPQGRHHGGHTEREQGEINSRLMEEIHLARAAGGILFAWLDEWFKRNWLVIAFEVPWENNKNWLNILDPEQNYGLVAYKPGRDGWRITIDGKGSDWDSVTPIAGDGTGALRWLRVTHDEAYLYMRLDVEPLDWDRTRYAVGIDTHGAEAGDHRMPFGLNLKTPTGMEFLLDLTGPTSSRLLSDIPYDLHTNRFNRPWRSSRNEDGMFTEMLAETNRRRVGRDGAVYPAITYSRSVLRYGTMAPDSPSYDDLVDWSDNAREGFIEGRIGWNLLNVTDPSTRQVLQDPVPARGATGHATTDAFRFYLAAYRPGDHRVVATLPDTDRRGRYKANAIPSYTWSPWEQPTYHSYLKKSYFILKERLASLDPLGSEPHP